MNEAGSGWWKGTDQETKWYISRVRSERSLWQASPLSPVVLWLRYASELADQSVSLHSASPLVADKVTQKHNGGHDKRVHWDGRRIIRSRENVVHKRGARTTSGAAVYPTPRFPPLCLGHH